MENKSGTRFMRFMGSKNLFFLLKLLILIGITIFIFNHISFIFYPFLVILSTVAAPVILAFVAYYLLNPVVNLLEKWHVKRIWGIVILILGIAGLLTGLVFLIAPHIEVQVKDLASQFPRYVQQMSTDFSDWIGHSFLGPYYYEGYEWVTTNLGNITAKVEENLGGAMEGIKNVASTVTQVVIAIATFPFILFFLLKDGARFRQFCLQLLPPKNRDAAARILHNMDVQVGSYIRGQIIVATCIGLLLFAGYLIIGLDYAIVLAVIAAVTSVVPYLGPIIAISPAIIIALVHSPFMLLKLAIVWAAVQFLEGHFISPNVMGRTMQIHPLTIMIVLLVAGKLFGLVGVILGIPGYAILKVIAVFLYDMFKLRYNRFYGKKFSPYEIEEKE
jgi:predicted PurR-regulated permease PerM